MRINYSTTKLVTVAVGDGTGTFSTWTDLANVLVEDTNFAYAASGPGGGGGTADNVICDEFGFSLPDFAVIDGIEVIQDCQRGGTAGVDTMIIGDGAGQTADKSNTIAWPSSHEEIVYGSPTDLWGETWTPAQINSPNFFVQTNYFHGSSIFTQYLYYVKVTVHWHIDLATAEAQVPTRFDYKVYDRDGVYIGDLPKVTSEFSFSQDINSAGSSLDITCGVKADNTTTTDELLTEAGAALLDEDAEVLLAEETTFLVIEGNSDIQALFKNSNRIEVYMTNYWYPNGKKMFQGQINRVAFSYGSRSDQVKLTVFSDGFDLANYIARGYPFSYSADVTNANENATLTGSEVGATWIRYGQTWTTGVGVTNLGKITLKLKGTGNVTVYVATSPNGTVLGSVTRSIANGSFAEVDFEFASLIDLNASTQYFFYIVPDFNGLQIRYHTTSSTYTGGDRYTSNFGGGGGGGYVVGTGDLYFKTASGTPTTTATYSTSDPITGMLSGILTDYNNRGGRITENNLTAGGTTYTYTFNVSTVFDAMTKCLEMAPSGYYSFIDLAESTIDVAPVATTADFTIVKGKDVNQIVMAMSIEQVKNYLLFTGGDTGGGTNLYQDYKDTLSQANYGLRTVAKTDNRVTVSATADAIGDSFIAENASELQETSVTVLNKNIDTTLLTPGKTVGFRNFGLFVDDLVLQIVRRDFSPDKVTLTLGRLPVRLNDEVQKAVRDLLNEQTADNPSAPS